MENTTVIDRAAAGDQQAWEEIVSEHRRRLRAIAVRYRLTPDESDDASQTTWLALVRHVATIRSRDQVAGWLSTTMHRNCLRLVRRRRTERLTEDMATAVVDPRITAEEAMILRERDQLLWDVIGTLPDRQAQLVRVLFAQDAPSYREIADTLSMAIGAIGPSRQRALRRIACLLARPGSPAHDLMRSA
jgi:RNA polymerase sigma factor (sigma-70 family)